MLNFLRRRDTDAENTRRATERTRRGLLGRVASIFRDSDLDEEAWEELEEVLISADVGVESTMELVDRLREERPSTSGEAFDILKREMVEMLRIDSADHPLDTDARPLVLLVVGVNGVGKTTGIAKLTNLYLQDGQQVLIGAADTFRAGAAEQLRTWGRRLDVDVVSHREGADPGAVAFDTVSAALSRNADVVIVDTAGRLHTKTNLMDELKKIRRVVARHVPESSIRVLLALDAVTGQNGLHQARAFTQALECHGVILSKLDGTAKGGIVLAITRELGIPVLYIGAGEQRHRGEQPDDIAAFDPQQFVDALFETECIRLSLDGLTGVGKTILDLVATVWPPKTPGGSLSAPIRAHPLSFHFLIESPPPSPTTDPSEPLTPSSRPTQLAQLVPQGPSPTRSGIIALHVPLRKRPFSCFRPPALGGVGLCLDNPRHAAQEARPQQSVLDEDQLAFLHDPDRFVWAARSPNQLLVLEQVWLTGLRSAPMLSIATG